MTDPPKEGRTVQQSRTTLSQLMQPESANIMGDIHGGWIMKLVDEAGALAAMRHSQSRVVTVALDQMSFHQPIKVGDLVTLDAEVTYVGRSSIETRVRVETENPVTGEGGHSNTAYAVYVALDEQGRPRPVPRLIPETAEQEQRMKEGKDRQAYRLQSLAREREIEE